MAVPNEQEIGLAAETVWRRRRRKSVTCSNLTTIQHNIYITNCILIYNYYEIYYVCEVKIVITMLKLGRRVVW
jgi:hypothetical protein